MQSEWKELCPYPEGSSERLDFSLAPPHLQKAAIDYYRYLTYIDGIGRITFSEAEFLGHGWIRLNGIDEDDQEPPFPLAKWGGLGRGIDARIDSIKWIIDADS